MSFTRRITALAIIFALLAVPAASFADGVRSFSIGNIALDIPGTQANIGATLNVDCGAKDERGLTTVTLLGGKDGTSEVGKAYIATDENSVTATLDGLTSAFSLTGEEIKQMMTPYAENFGEGAVLVKAETVGDFLQSLVNYIDDQRDIEKIWKADREADEKFFAYMGDRLQTVGEESYTVFGQTFTGRRIKFSMDADDMDVLTDVVTSANENLKLLNDSYIELNSQISIAQGGQPITSLTQWNKDRGIDYAYDIDMLIDETGAAQKLDMVISVTQNGETVSTPFAAEGLYNGDLYKQCFKMTTAVEGADIVADFDKEVNKDGDLAYAWAITVKADDKDSSMFMDMDVNMNANMNADGTYSAVYTVSGQGAQSGQVLDMGAKMALSGVSNDEKQSADFTADLTANGFSMLSAHFNYDGTVTKTGSDRLCAGKVTFVSDVVNYGHISFSADVAYADSSEAEVDFSAIDALNVFDFLKLDDDKKGEVASEVTVIGINALGVLMQTPGVAEIIAAAMASQTVPDGSSAYQYDEYGAGFDQDFDFDDFERQDEI